MMNVRAQGDRRIVEIDVSHLRARIVDGVVETWEPRTPPTSPDLACLHRGPEQEERECPTCTGTVRIKVFTCAIYGRCSISRDVGVALCQPCKDRRADP